MINLLARVLPRTMLAGVALSAATKSNYSFATEKKHQGGIFTQQFAANNPIENRLNVVTLDDPKGHYFAVFDGHGGDFVSEYVNKTLPGVMQQNLKNKEASVSDNEKIKQMITQSFVEVEKDLLDKIIKSNNIRNLTTGSCALVALLINKTLFVANSGDCEGLLIKTNGTVTTLNRRHNIAERDEQLRLTKLFPNQKDIAVNSRNGGCYLKGRLQPTHSFGDFYLKYKTFNVTQIPDFTGPYVEYRPEITTFTLADDDKYLILATDGLWDEYSHSEVASILMKNQQPNNPGKHLMDTTLRKISLSINVEPSKLVQVKGRRNIHDDISFVVVDLSSINK